MAFADTSLIAPAELEALARAFALRRGDVQLRERLCEAALPLVRRIAALIIRKLPAHFAVDDLLGDGCVGLLRAVDRFDPRFGVSFETWASRIVRGSMLNGLRRMDIVPERVRRDARLLERSRWRMALHEGVAPSDRRAASGAGLDDNKLRAVQLALRCARPYSLQAPLHGLEDITLFDLLPSSDADPAEVVARADARRALANAVAALPPRDRAIVAAFYSGTITFREIGGRFGISKQRVSQLHNRAIAGLRETLAPIRQDL